MATAKRQAKPKEREQSLLFIVAYVLTWITGIIVLVMAKPSEKRLRFNALQSVFLGIVIFVLWFIPVIGGVISFVLWIIGIIAGVRAYNGEDVVLPVIGDYAKRHS